MTMTMDPNNLPLEIRAAEALVRGLRGAQQHLPPAVEWTVSGDVMRATPPGARIHVEREDEDTARAWLRSTIAGTPSHIADITVHLPLPSADLGDEARQICQALYWSWWRAQRAKPVEPQPERPTDIREAFASLRAASGGALDGVDDIAAVQAMRGRDAEVTPTPEQVREALAAAQTKPRGWRTATPEEVIAAMEAAGEDIPLVDKPYLDAAIRERDEARRQVVELRRRGLDDIARSWADCMRTIRDLVGLPRGATTNQVVDAVKALTSPDTTQHCPVCEHTAEVLTEALGDEASPDWPDFSLAQQAAFVLRRERDYLRSLQRTNAIHMEQRDKVIKGRDAAVELLEDERNITRRLKEDHDSLETRLELRIRERDAYEAELLTVRKLLGADAGDEPEPTAEAAERVVDERDEAEETLSMVLKERDEALAKLEAEADFSRRLRAELVEAREILGTPAGNTIVATAERVKRERDEARARVALLESRMHPVPQPGDALMGRMWAEGRASHEANRKLQAERDAARAQLEEMQRHHDELSAEIKGESAKSSRLQREVNDLRRLHDEDAKVVSSVLAGQPIRWGVPRNSAHVVELLKARSVGETMPPTCPCGRAAGHRGACDPEPGRDDPAVVGAAQNIRRRAQSRTLIENGQPVAFGGSQKAEEDA